jgi:hypothetical protein
MPNLISNKQRVSADAIDVFIILLLATALDIFVLSLATQFVGSAAFMRLPDFLTSTYSAIWTSLASGVAGLGLVVVKALGTRRARRPNYLLWTPVSAGGLLLTIVAIAILTRMLNPYPRPEPPREVFQIDLSGQPSEPRQFEFSPLAGSRAAVHMVGTYSTDGKIVKGEMTSGELETSESYQLIFPMDLQRVAFRACYFRKLGGVEQMDVFPSRSSKSNSTELKVAMKTGRQLITLPPFKFSFAVPADAENGRIWLCAAIENSVGYIPAQ